MSLDVTFEADIEAITRRVLKVRGKSGRTDALAQIRKLRRTVQGRECKRARVAAPETATLTVQRKNYPIAASITKEQLTHKPELDPACEMQAGEGAHIEMAYSIKIRGSFKDAFWKTFACDLKMTLPIHDRVLYVLEEILEGCSALVPQFAATDFDVPDINALRDMVKTGARVEWATCVDLVRRISDVIHQMLIIETKINCVTATHNQHTEEIQDHHFAEDEHVMACSTLQFLATKSIYDPVLEEI